MFGYLGVIVKVLSPVLGLVVLGLGCAATSVVVGVGVRSLRDASLVDSNIFPTELDTKKADNAESNATA